MENTTVERSPAELPDEAPETPGVQIEILDGDGAEEGEGIGGGIEFFLLLEDMPVDGHAYENVDMSCNSAWMCRGRCRHSRRD